MPSVLPILRMPSPLALNSRIRCSTAGLTRRRPNFVPFPGAGEPRVDSLANYASLELGENAKHLKHRLARGRRGIKSLLVKKQTDTLFMKSLEDAEQVGERSTEPIHRPRRDHVELFRVHSTAHLAEGFALLRYPRNFNKTTGELSRRIVALSDDAQGTERINLQAFLLRAAVDEHSMESWRLIWLVLPELRVIVLQGNLPSVAHSILTDDLPRFYSAAYWDLNKRILLSLSRLYKSFPNETVLSELRLSDSEIRLVVFGDDKEGQSFFWDWF